MHCSLWNQQLTRKNSNFLAHFWFVTKKYDIITLHYSIGFSIHLNWKSCILSPEIRTSYGVVPALVTKWYGRESMCPIPRFLDFDSMDIELKQTENVLRESVEKSDTTPIAPKTAVLWFLPNLVLLYSLLAQVTEQQHYRSIEPFRDESLIFLRTTFCKRRTLCRLVNNQQGSAELFRALEELMRSIFRAIRPSA